MTFSEELEALLKEELKAIKNLKVLSFKKTDYIINNKIEELESILKEEEKFINIVGNLEVNRSELLDNWGLGKDTPISSVIEKVPEGRENLEKLREEIGNLLLELSQRNKANSALVKDNLDWIDFNINLMSSSQVPVGYGKDSEEKEGGNNRNLFDRKV